MSDLRTCVLDDRLHAKYLWRSNRNRYLYRYRDHCWEVLLDGVWEKCVDGFDRYARWDLVGHPGEVFIRVGEEI